jgi:hypothetical protein
VRAIAIAMLLCVGCGRISFDALSEPPGDGNGDGVDDGALTTGCGTNSGWVQSNGVYASNVTTLGIDFASAQTVGNTNIVVVQWGGTTNTVASVSDSAGNTYSLAIGPSRSPGDSQSIYYASGIAASAAGTNVVTVALTGAQNLAVTVFEYSDLAPTNVIDGAVEGSGVGTQIATQELVTTNECDLLFSANVVTNTVTSIGLGFTSRWAQTDVFASEKVVAAVGSYTATATQDLSGNYVTQMVAFKKLLDAPAEPAIHAVQASTALCFNCSSYAFSMLSPQHAGNTNLVAVEWIDQTGTLTSLTDSAGNVYTLAVGPIQQVGQSTALYYAKNIKAASANTITVTLSAAHPNIEVIAVEYAGLSTVDPFDVGAASFGSTTLADSGTMDTAFAQELIFGVVFSANNNLLATAGPGFRVLLDLPENRAAFMEDRVADSPGSFRATATFDGLGSWHTLGAGFH